MRVGVLNNPSQSGRSTVMHQEQVNDFLQIHPGSSVRSVAEASSIPHTTAGRIMTEHLLLKPYKVQFVQQLHGNAVAIND